MPANFQCYLLNIVPHIVAIVARILKSRDEQIEKAGGFVTLLLAVSSERDIFLINEKRKGVLSCWAADDKISYFIISDIRNGFAKRRFVSPLEGCVALVGGPRAL